MEHSLIILRNMGNTGWIHLTHCSLADLGCDLKKCNFQSILVIGLFRSLHGNAIRWMPQDLTDDKSTLFQVMAWCHQATSHYLSQCWPRSMLPYVVTRSQWVNVIRARNCIDGLTQDCGNCSLLAMELPELCPKPLIWESWLYTFNGIR